MARYIEEGRIHGGDEPYETADTRIGGRNTRPSNTGGPINDHKN